MAYELHVNAGVAGQQQLEQLTRATDSQSGSTAKLNDALYGLKGATEKQTEAQLKYATQLARTEEFTIRYKMAQLDAAAATDRGTQAVDRMAGAHRRAVTDVQAASGALRAMEGTIPIRAVEQFTTKVLGMGGAFQALFPAVGAVAALGILDRMVEKAGELYNAWNPIVERQKQSLKLMEESDKRYDSLISKSNQLRLDTYEREHGRPARLRLEAGESSQSATYDDARRIEYIQAQLENQQYIAARARLNDQFIPKDVTGFAKQHGLPTDPAAAGAMVSGLRAQLEEARLQQKVDQQTAADLEAKAKEAGLKAESPIAEYLKRSRERLNQSSLKELGPDGSVLPSSVYAGSLRKIKEERDDEIRKARLGHREGDIGQINAGAAMQSTAALLDFKNAIEKLGDSAQKSKLVLSGLTGITQERFAKSQDYLSEKEEMGGLDVAGAAVRSGLRRYDSDVIGSFRAKVAGAERALTQQGRNLADSERRDLSQLAARAQLNNQAPGTTIQQEFDIRRTAADKTYEIELKLANLKDSEEKKAAAREVAREQYEQKLFDVQMQREQSLIELAIKQKQQFEQGSLGLLHAIASGNAGSFITGQLQKIAEQLLVKLVLGPLFDKLAGAAGPKTVSIGDVIGGAAKDKIAADAPTKSNDDHNTDRICDAINNLCLSPSGGGGSASPFVNAGFGGGLGIPGLGSGGGGLGGGLKGMSTLGKAASIAGAGFGVYEGVSSIAKGGGRNIAGGVSDIAMSAALLDPEPISKMVLFGVGLVSGLIKGIFGDPKAERQAGITKALQTNQFMAPVAINASMSAGGGFSDFDRFGNVRDSSLSPFPTVQQGYFDARHDWTPVPGRVLNQFGGPGGNQGPAVVIHMNNLDAKSVLDRHADIGDAVARSLQLGSSGHLAETLTARGN